MFILASYDCGAGHLENAQRLTEKYGRNPQVWEDVSYWCCKINSTILKRCGGKVGFCHGLEAVNYVANILEPLQSLQTDLNTRRTS